MKKHACYPKVIIHRLGAPSVTKMPRAARPVWLRLLCVFLFVFAAGSLHAGTHTWSGAGANTLWSNALGTGTPGPEITGITKNGNSLTITVSWLPAMAGQSVDIQRAAGAAPNPLTIWGGHGHVILGAQGNGTVTSNVFGSSNFFRLSGGES